MTRKEKIEYLNGYHWAVKIVDFVKERITNAKRGADLDELYRRLDHAESKRLEIESVIRAIPDERLSVLLQLVYIDGLSLEQTAEIMGLSYSHVSKLHPKAVDLITIVKRKN